MAESELKPPPISRGASKRTGWRAARFVWPAIGIAAVVLSLWLLFRDLGGLSWREVERSLAAITAWHWVLAVISTVLAYTALTWYDRIALAHLGLRLPLGFIAAVSFTSYALAHNIGMSVFSGAMVRYRAYSTKGLTVAEVGVLVAFCSFTFGLGTALLGGIVFLVEPAVFAHMVHLPALAVRGIGGVLVLLVACYAIGSLLDLRPLTLGGLKLVYPRPGITARQLVAGPLELIGAAGIIYCALPVTENPGFVVVLGVFLVSFSAALLSHAPGGLGVLELVFLAGMPGLPKADVLAALLVFRLLYLLAPLAFGIVAVIVFERGRLSRPPDPDS